MKNKNRKEVSQGKVAGLRHYFQILILLWYWTLDAQEYVHPFMF